MRKKGTYPACFGILENVFPKRPDGLRQTPESCMVCYCKTLCLRTAVENPDGLKVKEEMIDRAYVSGTIGFLQRWSKRKSLFHQKKQHEKNDKERT
jgi:hypothetical protein